MPPRGTAAITRTCQRTWAFKLFFRRVAAPQKRAAVGADRKSLGSCESPATPCHSARPGIIVYKIEFTPGASDWTLRLPLGKIDAGQM